MTLTAVATFTVEAIPAAELDRIRAARTDEAGNRLTPQVLAEGGSPLRCCLRDADPGEQVLLIAYTPPGTAGAYAELGPVFVHAGRCAGYATPQVYPPGLAHRQQVVRGYDHQGRICGGVLVNDGAEATRVIQDMLAQPGVALVHLRNVGYGCYNFAVRPDASGSGLTAS